MNKIATYLNQHLLGEATGAKVMRQRFSRDGSILTVTPELVVFPRSTSDIRKVARFTWQLAEKGHPLAMTARGAGSDTTGAAVGKGVVIDTSAHLTSILNIVTKDKLVHAQPGVLVDTLQEALRWQGLSLQNTPADGCHTTLGGMVAGGAFGETGSASDAIEKLEVVLANGDIIETGRVSRHDVNKKLGLQTFEGEIYRKLSGILEDNEEIIARLASSDTPDSFGYKGIASIKQKDGSFDLTPLFVGSQGTLGVISEVVLRTDFYAEDTTAAVILASTGEAARDISDALLQLKPSVLHIIDGALINRAHDHGKQFPVLSSDEIGGSVVYVEFKDFSDRARNHKVKKLRKITNRLGVGMVDSTERNYDDFRQLKEVGTALQRMAEDNKLAVPIIDGAYLPDDRREDALEQIAELAAKQHVELPTIINANTGIVTAYPILHLHVMSDKQKLFRLMAEYAAIVTRCGGSFVADGGEGRLKSHAVWSMAEDEVASLYEQVRSTFDPFHTLNPGVKEKTEVRTLVAQLRSSYDTTDFVA